MKKFYFIVAALFYFILSFGQAPSVKWSRSIETYSGYSNLSEVIYDLKSTSDKGYIAAGADSLFEYDWFGFSMKELGDRAWLAKTDSAGNRNWIYTYNFSKASAFTSVEIVDDGYVAAGYQRAASGTNLDAILYKVDKQGQQIWNKTYGGSGNDVIYSVSAVSSGGFILAGYTTSNDGDVSGNHAPGREDVWLVKTDDNGNIVWKKCFGGSDRDKAWSVIETTDQGFLVVGWTSSPDGDVVGYSSVFDGWALKIDSEGNLLWQKCFGADGSDRFFKAVENPDGSFVIAGALGSEAPIISNSRKGGDDFWLVKLSSDGQVLLSLAYGGWYEDIPYSLMRTQDNGYLLGGITKSNNLDVSGSNGGTDGWLIKIDDMGNLLWQKCIGTSSDEFIYAAIPLTEYDFIVGGLIRNNSTAPTRTDAYLVRSGNSSIIQGTITGPVSLQNLMISATKPGVESSGLVLNNEFKFSVDTGSYIIKAVPPYPYYNITPASYNVSINTYFDTASLVFDVQPIPNLKDITVSAIPLDIARPGFSMRYQLMYSNNGTETIPAGQVQFKKDSRLSYVSASTPPVNVVDDIIQWNYSGLQPFDTATILIEFNIAPPPGVNIGDTLASTVTIGPAEGDQTPADDTTVIRQLVAGSYDPNDKYGNWGSFMPVQKVVNSPYINYIIRFQNTGTDTAFTVHVRDTLDSRLDWTSLQMLDASHKYNLSITNKNRLDWAFTDINLVDSNRNEPASHGYVTYRIKTKNNVPAGDTIHNTASIYFDYNLPVMTNNAFTRIVNENIALPLTLLDFRAGYQSPEAVLFWQTADEYNVDRFEIERSTDANHFEKAGTVPFRQSSGGFYQFKEDLSTKTGVLFYYRLKMIDQDGTFKYSHTQLVRKGDRGNMEIIVSPNPMYHGLGRVYVNLAVASEVQFGIVDMQGRLLHQQLRSLEKGFNSLQYDMSLFPAGNYILQIKAGRETRTTRFLLVK
ncbi:MAG: T9SS type A sorting domain-containing protein [Chitinophagaceae bacterium]